MLLQTWVILQTSCCICEMLVETENCTIKRRLAVASDNVVVVTLITLGDVHIFFSLFLSSCEFFQIIYVSSTRSAYALPSKEQSKQKKWREKSRTQKKLNSGWHITPTKEKKSFVWSKAGEKSTRSGTTRIIDIQSFPIDQPYQIDFEFTQISLPNSFAEISNKIFPFEYVASRSDNTFK